MKNSAVVISLVLLVGCGRTDDKTSSAGGATTTTATSDSAPAVAATADSVSGTNGSRAAPAVAMDTFLTANGHVSFNSRKNFDLTGDGKPEFVAVYATGPRTDSMAVRLSILFATGDTLYAHAWSTRMYFHYSPRSGFSSAAADSLVLNHLKALTADKAFTAHGPSALLRKSNASTGGIDRDAVRYDIKEQGVRASQRIPPAIPLTTAALTAQEKFAVSDASIDSLVTELKNQPTFTFFAGGEVTNTIAWSNAKHRFIRIFSCC